MVEKFRNDVKIPVWMFGIVLSILLALFAYNTIFASTRKQVEVNTVRLDNVEKNKAEKSDVDRIYVKLDKIEGLLIEHMERK